MDVEIAAAAVKVRLLSALNSKSLTVPTPLNWLELPIYPILFEEPLYVNLTYPPVEVPYWTSITLAAVELNVELPVTCNEPVNSCLSSEVLPNLLEPLWYITEDDT